MKLLLDTVTFLDTAFSSRSLSKNARGLLLDPASELYVSIASYWEIAIKHSLGKLVLPDPPERFIPLHQSKLGAEILPLDEESVFQLVRLPSIHNDPFDRILICQALVHGMILITPDERISRYPVRTGW